ncbi:LCP family protein [Mycetocola spongiae]|uniref:LCP family protein n=1 Tax=Mycetocola spongiae TaxID=2859226 RepID=UPI001CF33539|nr:LCP family protein [Mycetocola spongiae]UCR88138.1 LCP family protein [Mycetocola spongiae]
MLVWTATLTAMVMMCVGGFAATAYLRVLGNITENVVARPGSTEKTVEIPDWDGPVNLLIMGSDTRDGQVTGDYGQDEHGARSDVLMLLHVSANHEDATLVSFPRDTMMPIPSCTDAAGNVSRAQRVGQINSALGYGPHCSLDAIREFTGLDIDHFVVVDFDAAITVTEAIGGVDVCLAEDVDDKYSGLNLPAGMHNVQGAEALAFLRTRHGFGDGSDMGRIAAQQSFLSALARKVKSAGTLSNPVALFSLADAASKSISVDQALGSLGSMVGLLGTLAGVDLERMVLIQLPVQDYPADRNRVEPIKSETDQIFAALRADVPLVLAGSEPPATDPATTDPAAPETQAPAVPETPAAPETGAASPPPTVPVPLPTTLRGQTANQETCAK